MLVHKYAFLGILELPHFPNTNSVYFIVIFQQISREVLFTFTLKLQAPTRTDFSSSCHCDGLLSAVVVVADVVVVVVAAAAAVVVVAALPFFAKLAVIGVLA